MVASYSAVAKRVNAALANDDRTSKFSIEAIDNNGVVTLKGTLTSEKARQTAEEIARKQEGVLDVINDLQVESKEKQPVIIPSAPQA